MLLSSVNYNTDRKLMITPDIGHATVFWLCYSTKMIIKLCVLAIVRKFGA